MDKERRLKVIVILLLKIVESLLAPVSFIVYGLDALIAPLLGMASSITFIFAAIQFPLYLFGYILGSKELIIFIFTFASVLLPLEFASSLIWWVIYKLPALGVKNK